MSKMKRIEASRPRKMGKVDLQDNESKPNLKILTSESTPTILYAIGWLDFEESMSRWPQDLLKQIIERNEAAQEQIEEEEKSIVFSSIDKHHTDSSKGFEVSKLFDSNLRELWTDLEEVEIIQRFNEILEIKQPEHYPECKKLFQLSLCFSQIDLNPHILFSNNNK